MGEPDFTTKDRSRIARYLVRGAFVVAILSAGFALEFFFQSRNANRSVTEISDAEYPIVLLGGSTAKGLGSHVEAYLSPNLKAKVVESTSAMLPSLGLDSMVKEVVAKYRPKLVLVQIGLSEMSPEESAWNETAMRFIASRDVSSFVEIVTVSLESDRKEDWRRLIKFFITKRESIHQAGFDEDVLRTLDAHVEKYDVARRIETSIILLRLMMTPEAIEFAMTKRQLTPEQHATNVNAAFDRVAKIAKDWPRELDRLGGERFVESRSRPERYLRHWFRASWTEQGRASGLDGVTFYSRNPHLLMKIVGGAFALAEDERVISILKPREPTDLWNALFASRGDVEFDLVRDESASGRVKSDFMKNVASAVTAAKAAGVRVVFLQYPNQDVPMVESAGRELDVPVIESGEYFANKLREKGRVNLFLDRTDQTGHLTVEGLSIFGRHVAERLNEIVSAEPK